MNDTRRSYVEEWDRSLRAANRPHTTRYNYELAVTQLADFLGGPELPAFLAKMDMPADDDSDAADDPTDVGRKHVEWFITWMIDSRSASTAPTTSSSARRSTVIPWRSSASRTHRTSLYQSCPTTNSPDCSIRAEGRATATGATWQSFDYSSTPAPGSPRSPISNLRT